MNANEKPTAAPIPAIPAGQEFTDYYGAIWPRGEPPYNRDGTEKKRPANPIATK